MISPPGSFFIEPAASIKRNFAPQSSITIHQSLPTMFGDLFGNVEQQQEEMRKKLAEVTVTADAGGGAVTVTANANREILDVKIDKSKLDWEDLEEVQDLLVAAVNNALEKAMVEEQAETQKLISQMLPPGMSGLFGG